MGRGGIQATWGRSRLLVQTLPNNTFGGVFQVSINQSINQSIEHL